MKTIDHQTYLALREGAVVHRAKQDVAPVLPEPVPAHGVELHGQFVVGAEGGAQLLFGPHVEAALLALAVGVERAGEGPLR